MKYKRVFRKTESSVLLLGPRGTGKSTFIKENLNPQLTIDLLRSVDFKSLSANPTELEDRVGHLKSGDIVFIDEIQKIPILLDEVHRLMQEKKLRFILSGSSARKLKQQGVNLLAGRAIGRKMYPLSLHEIDKHKRISELIFTGTLPQALNLKTKDEVNDYLFSYVDTYLKEEIFQEGLTRNLNEFTHFIEVAAQYNGQIINFENISREVGKSGDTVKSWFQILLDTFLGNYLEPYSFKLLSKETKHSKFYFFDNGISRAAEGLKSLEGFSEKNGFYLESLILNELKVFKEATCADFKIYFYNLPSVGDIDFVVEIKKKSLSKPSEVILFDIKHSKTWNNQFGKVSKLVDQKIPQRVKKIIGIYLGDKRLTKSKLSVYPIDEFIKALWAEKIF